MSGEMVRVAAVVVALAGQHCTSRAIGPGTHVEGGTHGATCLLAAFRDRCRPAQYVLTGVGISTFAVENFSVERWSGRCAVVVIKSVTVIQGKPQVTGPLICRRLRRVGTDVVVDRCSTGATRAFSLTSFA